MFFSVYCADEVNEMYLVALLFSISTPCVRDLVNQPGVLGQVKESGKSSSEHRNPKVHL